ncbi:MAG: hypothetical protein RE471_09055 [Ferroplasma sp.]|uniref:hypothetical protein n=1 Tax=Ferroplasma sp. TaxID=2591003 RepID=UPI002814BCAA|nr:hypothetical protein [Ferroplasma sp.]WMT51112.1 MAG: hypothetical protein RE471_09055 [Ferroplasma sp.]
MVSRKVLVGIVLIIAGIALVIPGVVVITSEPSGNTVIHYSGDIYTSPEFNFTENKILIMVSSDTSSAGLVNCTAFKADAGKFNSSSIHNYTVSPARQIDGEPMYENLNGSYRYVVVSGSRPTLDYNFISHSEIRNVTDASYIAAAGALLTGAGIIITMVTILFGKINSRKPR